MDTSQSISDETRKMVYGQLAEAMLTTLENGQFDYEESQKSAEYVLEHLEKVATVSELKQFLIDLSALWPQYSLVLQNLQSLEQEHHDNKKLEAIESELQKIQQ